MMREEDYTIFEYRMGKEKKYADLIVDEKINGVFEKVCVRTKDAGYIDMSIYRPLNWNEESLLKPVFNFHGGGNVLGYYEQDGKYCRLLADLTGCAIINVDYAIAPEFKFPIPLYSSYDAIVELLKDASNLKLDAQNVMVMGHSAGGYISSCLTLIDRDRKEIGIKGAILDYSPLRQELSPELRKVADSSKAISENRMLQYINWYYNNYDELDNPLASPLLADLHDLPKTLVISAEYDSLKNEEKAYADKMKENGGEVKYVEFKNCCHGFTHDCFNEYMPKESKEAWNLMADFIKEVMG
jgi:acetyl esterase